MTKKKPKVSIIVPVYNIEKYLNRCIDSILSQTFTDFELLLVDDGSKDKSGDICEAYKTKDSRISVFHKFNGGVSSARNFGLDKALGDWVTFVDADDELQSSYLSNLLSLVDNDTSMVVANYIVNENDNIVSNQIEFEEGTLTAEQYLVKFFYDDKVRNEVWSKLFNLHDIGTLRFNTTIAIGEDLLFNLEYCFKNKCKKIKFRSFKDYIYRIVSNSAMRIKTDRSLEYEKIILCVKNKFNDTEFRCFVPRFSMNQYWTILDGYHFKRFDLTSRYDDEILNEIKNLTHLTKKDKLLKAYSLCHIWGFIQYLFSKTKKKVCKRLF